ncbi:small-subunit processome [Metschnikowia bicuspidata]|uniref:Small-subunit processome n=1 Tax=Metschnikowia bicuspidata TaxID=27322 RepID=A0A4P9ZB28_9ASCO|nr:small-subunit processome [Metschnikowia bicuspidata]
MAKKKQGRSQKHRSEKKILDAFHLAECRENGSDESDSGEELQVRDGIMNARKFMKNPDDDAFEDEEIDSDEVLNSGDDYDVLDSKFSHTIRDKRKNGVESESEYDSIDESQLVTLSEAWDLEEKYNASKTAKKVKSGSSDVVLEDTWESEELESEDDQDEHGLSSLEDEEEVLRGADDANEVNMSNTLSIINMRLSKKPEKKRLINETARESQFAVPTGGAKLSLAEMLGGADAADATLLSKDHAEEHKPLDVPLLKRIQERTDREVAYEITKKEVSKWEETVRAICDAEKLQFPLVQPSADEQEEVDAEREVDSLQIIQEIDGKSTLESKINDVLRAGALSDESKEATFEQMAAAKLSKEEMLKRTQELRRMRELMFRDEQRAKRIKKIKSKQFRRIRKRESLRDAALVEGSEESDSEDHDRRRAEERVSLRHKTQSKWSKSVIKSGITKDASTRAELEEMLRLGERLRSKQLGHREGEQSDDGVSDIERDYEHDDRKAEETERGLLGKGVLAMDFMKAAEERKRKENLREIAFLKDMRDGTGMEDFVSAPEGSVNKIKNQGRRVYVPSAVVTHEEMAEVEEEVLHDFRDDEARNLEKQMRGRERSAADSERDTDRKRGAARNSRNPLSNAQSDSDAEENPWLAGMDETTAKSHKYVAIAEDSSRMAKAAHKIQKSADKQLGKAKAKETYIDLNQVMQISRKVHGSEDEGEDQNGSETRMFLQKNLILEAFAGYDVVSEFQQEKRDIEEAEDDRSEDMTLPGWGGWAGADITAAPKKRFVRKIDGVVQKDKRLDKGLKNVIVNETLNKHNLKYQSSSVPYPYESKEQYERALRMPIGEEWTSQATHSRATKPRIVVKQGVVVDPLKAPFN